MNNQRRKELREACDLIERAKSILLETAEQEREAWDNMPEGFQESERGQEIDENADILEGLPDELEAVVDSITEILEK